MKKTFSELIDTIPIYEERLPSEFHSMVATCPICGMHLTIPVVVDVHTATVTAQNTVVAHLRCVHPALEEV